MNERRSTAENRKQLLAQLFPEGAPPLWCPMITHYRDDGAIDTERTAAHLRHLSPHVGGFLIPGSTGDGWEMTTEEIRQLLEVALEQAARLNVCLLIGVLKTDAAEARQAITDTFAWLQQRVGLGAMEDCLRRSRVSGFTVCPPRGSALSQEEISAGLCAIAETGLPVAIYQLPQVTQNEMAPGLVADLAARFANFILFKDTSGADRAALSSHDFGGVFLVRGAEGGYARWLKAAGGPYDGFLLSTANGFGRELRQIIRDAAEGRLDDAVRMSERISTAVAEVFNIVAGLPHGNAFANANKAVDHFFAFGPKAASATPPRLHAGSRLPTEAVRATGEVLARCNLMPVQGYLD